MYLWSVLWSSQNGFQYKFSWDFVHIFQFIMHKNMTWTCSAQCNFLCYWFWFLRIIKMLIVSTVSFKLFAFRYICLKPGLSTLVLPLKTKDVRMKCTISWEKRCTFNHVYLFEFFHFIILNLYGELSLNESGWVKLD